MLSCTKSSAKEICFICTFNFIFCFSLTSCWGIWPSISVPCAESGTWRKYVLLCISQCENFKMSSLLLALWYSHPSARCCMHISSRGDTVTGQNEQNKGTSFLTSVLQIESYIVILGHFDKWTLTRPSLHEKKLSTVYESSEWDGEPNI